MIVSLTENVRINKKKQRKAKKELLIKDKKNKGTNKFFIKRNHKKLFERFQKKEKEKEKKTPLHKKRKETNKNLLFLFNTSPFLLHLPFERARLFH